MKEISADKGYLEADNMLAALQRGAIPTAQINEALCNVLCHNLCIVIQSRGESGEPE